VIILKKYFIDFLNRIDASYPEFVNDCNVLIDGYETELIDISNSWRNFKKIETTLEKRKILSEKSGVHLYAVNMAVVVVASKWLLED
jgi:hypothetical protein